MQFGNTAAEVIAKEPIITRNIWDLNHGKMRLMVK